MAFPISDVLYLSLHSPVTIYEERYSQRLFFPSINWKKTPE